MSDCARPWRGVHEAELAGDPQLSAIAMLDAILTVTIAAIPAFVPELDPRSCTWDETSPEVLAARQLLVYSQHLRKLIADYRRELDRSIDGDIPF